MRRALVLLVLAACTPSLPRTDEQKARDRLGIPDGARTVVVFAQTAHLDIDWQRTFDDYYARFVESIFLEARRILDEQPRAFYSVAEMAYLRHHVETHPEELPILKRHAARGALRVVGGGVTSPDTLLPETELLVRDFLYGVRFAEETLGARPRAAWLPDSFGHAATAPDLLAAAGFTSVAFARIDGAPTFFEELRDPGAPPLAGSNAERLKQLGSADFVWRGPGGGALLAHWMPAALYCQGDNLDYDELIQIPGQHVGVYNGDQPAFTDGRIDEYIAQLAPYAKTPYLFVPVGCDFQHPKEELLDYLDGYNRRRFPSTKAWAVAAPFEDFAALVEFHRAELPELAVDLTPYFMGFYATRPEVKRRVREAARPFSTAEPFAVALGDEGRAILAAAQPAHERLARADHHDFVTGTATDEVTSDEQLPLCDQAQAAGERALSDVVAALSARIPSSAATRVIALNPSSFAHGEVIDLATAEPLHPSSGEAERLPGGRLRLAIPSLPPFAWRAIDLLPGAPPSPAPSVSLSIGASVVLSNARVRAEFSPVAGSWALVSLRVDGVEALAGPSFTVGDYADQGGLWRLGHEMAGCALTPTPAPAAMETVEARDVSSLAARVAFVSPGGTREARLDALSDGIDLAITAAALGPQTTRTVSFHLAGGAPRYTSQPAGFVERPVERVYSPTFWPAVEWLSTGEWAILLRQSTGVRFDESGRVELMTMRDARSEQCDIEGGTGSDPGAHRIEWRLGRVAGPSDAARRAQAFNRPIAALLSMVNSSVAAALPVEQSLLSVEGEGLVSALKPADRGEGAIVRVMLSGAATLRLAPLLAGRARYSTDAVEREGALLGDAGDAIALDRATHGALPTLRLK